jgi:hypothetical protein
MNESVISENGKVGARGSLKGAQYYSFPTSPV